MQRHKKQHPQSTIRISTVLFRLKEICWVKTSEKNNCGQDQSSVNLVIRSISRLRFAIIFQSIWKASNKIQKNEFRKEFLIFYYHKSDLFQPLLEPSTASASGNPDPASFIRSSSKTTPSLVRTCLYPPPLLKKNKFFHETIKKSTSVMMTTAQKVHYVSANSERSWPI